MKLISEKRIGQKLTECEKRKFIEAIKMTLKFFEKYKIEKSLYNSPMVESLDDKSIVKAGNGMRFDRDIKINNIINVKGKIGLSICNNRDIEVFKNILILGSLINKSKDPKLSLEFSMAFNKMSKWINMEIFEKIVLNSNNKEYISEYLKCVETPNLYKFEEILNK